ncbi:MAG TPA: hypothetical protein VL485_18530 [Ktedonobacteraceae bacterium]|jgi:hypothetical protein|nr:hypothetical protein [Ktedonobacteraceae bacterium]
MSFAGSILIRSFFYCVLSIIDFFLLLGTCSILRLIRISVNWTTWIIGSILILNSVLIFLSLFFPQLSPFQVTEAFLAALSFLIAVYTAGQWFTRHWYIQIKKRTTSRIVLWSKNALLFLRKHHEFFGWVVTFTALAHMANFLPTITTARQYEVITGFIALGILLISVILGLWIWYQKRTKKLPPKTVHTIHAALTITFFIALFFHM